VKEGLVNHTDAWQNHAKMLSATLRPPGVSVLTWPVCSYLEKNNMERYLLIVLKKLL